MEKSFRNRKARAFFLGGRKAKCPNEDVNNIRRPICWNFGNDFIRDYAEIIEDHIRNFEDKSNFHDAE